MKNTKSLKKIIIGLLALSVLSGSVYASPKDDMLGDNTKSTRDFKVHVFDTLEKQEALNEQLSEALLKQGTINTTQTEVNDITRGQIKSLNTDIGDIRTKISYINNQGNTSNASVVSSDVKYINQKVNSLEDKLYRLERMLSQQDDRLRNVERKIK